MSLLRLLSMVAFLAVGAMACQPEDRDASCDDGTPAVCRMVAPERCPDGLILAHRNHCFVCVDPHTCEPPPRK